MARRTKPTRNVKRPAAGAGGGKSRTSSRSRKATTKSARRKVPAGAKPAAPVRASSLVKSSSADRSLGGVHGDSAVLKDFLAASAIRRSDTKEPLSEALCFGIAGGIAAGYSFVPGFAATGLGSGFALVGRHRQFLPDGRWQMEALRRLGLRWVVVEEPHPERASANLVALLTAKRPVIAWCSAMAFAHLSWAATAGLHTLLAHSIDRKRKQVVVSDQGPEPFDLPLAELDALRERVNPAQNRLLALADDDHGRRIERDDLAVACIAGIKACVLGARDLEHRGRHSQPLAECAGAMAQLHHSHGWRTLFPEGQLFLALSDVFQSIEAAWTGGGWFRPLYATFLDEASELTGNARLAECAKRLRALGARWTKFAEAALPKRYAVFARTRDALREVELQYAKKGRGAYAAILKQRASIAEQEKAAVARFPLDGHDANRLLDALSGELAELARDEEAAANELRATVLVNA